MPVFTYKAKDVSGKTIQDQIIAKDYNAALLNLRQQKLVTIYLKEGERGGIFTPRQQRVTLKQIAQFSRRLATLVGAGMPLVKDLKVLAGQTEDKRLKQIVNSLCQRIEAGTSLSEALSDFRGVFSPLYINMVAAGEVGGALSEILDRLAIYLEKTDVLVHRVKNAMIYPVAVIIISMCLSAFLILFVIPQFKTIFLSLGATKLPLPTEILVNFSEFCRHYVLQSFFGGFFLWVTITRYINTSKGRFQFETLKLRLPIFGALIRKFVIARFSRTLATLLKSGVPILNSLEIVAQAAGNKVVEAMVMKIMRQVSQGQRLTIAMEKEKFFPAMVVEMMGVGEESGQLESMLNKIADAYEEDVETTISGLISLLEPAIIVFLAVVVGTIVFAMFLPILKITQLISR